MSLADKGKHILAELKGHAPFTLLGAVFGLIFMLAFKAAGKPPAETLFMIFHPAHVVLSAMVTASMFKLHKKIKSFLIVLLIGYVGSIGIATLSDSIIPFLGENIMGLKIPTHADSHHEENQQDYDKESAIHEDSPTHGLHLGFIEEWYIVNPAAILGVIIACFMPRTKFPHAAHVLISTWASSAHIMMNTAAEITPLIIAGIFLILFVSVWLPCCISDIVFPLLFVKSDLHMHSQCDMHKHHSHPHKTESPENKK